MKKCDEALKQIFFKLYDIDEILGEQKNWLNIAECYCENNPENEESPCNIILLLDEIAKTNNKLIMLNEEIIEDLSKL